MFLILISVCSVAEISFAEILLSDSGLVTYPAGNGYRNRSVVKKYYFTLDKDSEVNLNFISHIDRYVGIKLMETETENVVKSLTCTISMANSPFNRSVDLRAGKYTFLIIKERSSGREDNTGSFRFTINKKNMFIPLEPLKVMVPSEKSKDEVVKTVSSESDKKEDLEERNLLKGVLFATAVVPSMMAIANDKHKFFWLGVSVIMIIVGSNL